MSYNFKFRTLFAPGQSKRLNTKKALSSPKDKPVKKIFTEEQKAAALASGAKVRARRLARRSQNSDSSSGKDSSDTSSSSGKECETNEKEIKTDNDYGNKMEQKHDKEDLKRREKLKQLEAALYAGYVNKMVEIENDRKLEKEHGNKLENEGENEQKSVNVQVLPGVTVVYDQEDACLVKRINPYYRSKYQQFTVNEEDAKQSRFGKWELIACGQVMSASTAVSQLPLCHCDKHHVVYRPYWIYNSSLNRICSMGRPCLERMGFEKEELAVYRRALRSCLSCSVWLPCTSLPNRLCEACHLQVGKEFKNSTVEQVACDDCFRYSKAGSTKCAYCRRYFI